MASMKMNDVRYAPSRNHPITQRWPVCSLRGIKSYLGQQREALPELGVRSGGGGGGGGEGVRRGGERAKAVGGDGSIRLLNVQISSLVQLFLRREHRLSPQELAG